ncbi:MAG: IS1634 family transposase [Nitrospirota bacterium]
MYFRTATKKRGDKRYQSLHLVESYRSKGGKVRQKIIINFGPAHKYTKEQVEEIIRGLKKFFRLDEPDPEILPPETSQDFGGTYVIFRIWEELGWSEVFKRHLHGRRYDFDVIPNLKVLVANRILDPLAKLHILDWMEGVYFPGIDREQIDYNHLLRSMDFLIEHKRRLEPQLAFPILTLFDNALDLVFYDLTSCYFEIDSQDKDRKDSKRKGKSSLRNYGHDRDRSGCPQVVLGIVMTKDGIPLCHYVFAGQTPDKSTFKEVIDDVKARFPVKRCIVVGDRGILTEENLKVLTEADLDYIVARPLRQNKISKRVIEAVEDRVKEKIKLWEKERTPLAKREYFHDVIIEGRRFVVSHHDEIARQTRKSRKSSLSQATSYVKWRVARTTGQQEGKIPIKGKALNYQETLLHLHDYLKDRKLLRYYRVWLDDHGKINWEPNEENRRWENKIDGKLLLEITTHSLTPEQVVHQYKELQELERCFRTLKSSLDIRPIHHWVDRRIQAHIFMCVMALQIHRLMRHRLHKANILRSPERVLEKLSFQRTVEAKVGGKRIHGLIRPTPEQLSFFDALNIPAPQHKNLANPTL